MSTDADDHTDASPSDPIREATRIRQKWGFEYRACLPLAERFGSVEAIENASADELLEVKNVGPGTAATVLGIPYKSGMSKADIRRRIEDREIIASFPLDG